MNGHGGNLIVLVVIWGFFIYFFYNYLPHLSLDLLISSVLDAVNSLF